MHLLLSLAYLAAIATPLLPQEILVPNKSWELLGQGYQLTAESAVDKDGSVFFSDAQKNRILEIDLDGKIRTWKEPSNGTHGVAFGPDGRLYAGQHDRKRIVAFTSDGKESVIAEGIQTHHLTVTSRNEIYFSEAPAHKIWMIDQSGNRRVVYEGLNWPHSLRVSPDRSLLIANDPGTKWIWSFQIQKDGSLTNARQFCQLGTKGGSADADPGGMAFDSEGFLYVATKTGVQVCDRQGRITTTLDPPASVGLAAVFFGGPNFEWLYVTDGDKIYRRQVRRRGVH